MTAKTLTSIEELLFTAPLYAKYKIGDDKELLHHLFGRAGVPYRFDAHCPYCGKSTTWTLSRTLGIPNSEAWAALEKRIALDDMEVTCGRVSGHKVTFYLYLANKALEKIGQFPSLASIANDETRAFRGILSANDASEFHKAIGLAAHGVGVGSFVYLRRIFENLVFGRYQEYKEAEGWDDDAFNRLRMSEKIEFLKGHLPPFLVENSKIYGILSAGIHELTEESCLSFFNVLKQSIIIILEEDKKKQEELQLRKQFTEAINNFSAKA